MKKSLKITLILVCFLLLFLVRGFADKLFYDPLIAYFKNDYLHTKIPYIDLWCLVRDLLFRFAINSAISICIIWLLFNRKDYVKFTSFFLISACLLLMVLFIFLIKDNFESGYLLPFYIRRLLIHPIFLLILLPSFYFQKLNNNK